MLPVKLNTVSEAPVPGSTVTDVSVTDPDPLFSSSPHAVVSIAMSASERMGAAKRNRSNFIVLLASRMELPVFPVRVKERQMNANKETFLPPIEVQGLCRNACRGTLLLQHLAPVAPASAEKEQWTCH
jgi:hypothetical protein